jgi:hypothetical protein
MTTATVESSAGDAAVDAAEPKRRFTRACIAGAVPASLLFTWMLTAGFHFGRWQATSELYDAQARSLLHGSLSMPPAALGIEGFLIGHSAYMYQGPTPALVRLPLIALFGDRLDGRLSQWMMLIAFAVLVVFGSRLHWRVRRAFRGESAVGRFEWWAVALVTFVMFGGSTVLFLASRSYVFHESVIWGLAFAFVSFDAILAYLDRGKLWLLAWASTAVTLTFLSRASLGLGALGAIGLLFLGQLFRWIRRRPVVDPEPSPEPDTDETQDASLWLESGTGGRSRRATATLLACVAPVVVYCVINVVKFDSLTGVPWARQQYSLAASERREFLAQTGGSFFGLDFIPSTVVDYLRPDGLAFEGLFPWVAPPHHTDVIGNVRFDTIERTASLPASVPLLVVLSIVGVIALAARKSSRAVQQLRIPAFGALVGSAAIFPFGYIAQRYLADVFPFLFVAGVVGLHWLLLRWAAPSRSARRRWVVAGLCVLGVFTVWVNFALAIGYQRLTGANLDDRVVAGYVGFQQDVAELYSDDSHVTVRQGSTLPLRAPAGEFFVLGDCDGLYYSDGTKPTELVHTSWKAVERTNAAGHYVVDVTFPHGRPGTSEPIFESGTPTLANVLEVEYQNDDDVTFRFRGQALDQMPEAVHIDPGREYRLDIAADSQLDMLVVRLDDRVVATTVYGADADNFTFGRNPLSVPGVEPAFTGTLHKVPVAAPVCRQLRDRSGLRAAGT